MRFRIASVAFVLGVLATTASWLTIQPALSTLLEIVRQFGGGAGHWVLERVWTLIPMYILLDLVMVSACSYVLLQMSVGRPLRMTEAAIEQMAQLNLNVRLEEGGPLMSRLQTAVRRTAEVLQTERNVVRTQFEQLKNANESLVRAHAELVATDRLATVGKLASGVAHEIGNPLAGVLGYLSVVRGRVRGQADLEDLIGRTEAEVQRIDQIVRSLLELGRPSRGKSEPVHLQRTVDSCRQLLAAGKEFTNVKVQSDVGRDVYVMGEAGPIAQIIINLLLNAAQAMGGRGTIRVATVQSPGAVELRIVDEGPGLAEEVRQRLFEPFFTTKLGTGGTGLGLAVSRHLAATMGGELTGENGANGGAVFSLRLPVPA